jgi:hypothetical protein
VNPVAQRLAVHPAKLRRLLAAETIEHHRPLGRRAQIGGADIHSSNRNTSHLPPPRINADNIDSRSGPKGSLRKRRRSVAACNAGNRIRLTGFLALQIGATLQTNYILLKDLIEGYSEIPLGNKSARKDVLGDAYEYLIGKFAEVTRRNKAGVGAGCPNWARPDRCGGRGVTRVPTAIYLGG